MRWFSDLLGQVRHHVWIKAHHIFHTHRQAAELDVSAVQPGHVVLTKLSASPGQWNQYNNSPAINLRFATPETSW